MKHNKLQKLLSIEFKTKFFPQYKNHSTLHQQYETLKINKLKLLSTELFHNIPFKIKQTHWSAQLVPNHLSYLLN